MTIEEVNQYIYDELQDIKRFIALTDDRKVEIGKPTCRLFIIWFIISAPIIVLFVYSTLPPTASERGIAMSGQVKTPAENCNDNNDETVCSSNKQKNPFFVMEYSCQIVITNVEVRLQETANPTYKSEIIVTVINSEPAIGTLASGISQLEKSPDNMQNPGGVIIWTGNAKGKYVVVQRKNIDGELILADVIITYDKDCVDRERLDGWDITRVVLLCIGAVTGFGGTLAAFINFMWSRCCCQGACTDFLEIDVRIKTDEWKEKEKAYDYYRKQIEKDMKEVKLAKDIWISI